MRGITYLILVLVDHGEIEVPVAVTDSNFNLWGPRSAQSYYILQYHIRHTEFSTSLGFESQVPRPICGRGAPLDKVIIFPWDMVNGFLG